MASTYNQDSIETLLAWMRQANNDYTLGWSAIAAYDRQKANRLLLQEYIERYQSSDFLEPTEGRFEGVDENEHIWLGGVVYDAPRLSFDASTLTDSTATLTWQGIEGPIFRMGNWSYVNNPVNWQIVQVGYETGMAGAYLTQTVRLATTSGAVDDKGEVYLDIASPVKGSEARYNVAAAPVQQQRAAEKLQAWLQQHQAGKATRYVLSKVVSHNQQFFNPTDFAVRTHPSAQSNKAASGASDGAVLVFIQADKDDAGSFPNPNTYKYLIPQGYSATMALAAKFILRRYLQMSMQVLNPDGEIAMVPAQGIPDYAEFRAGTLRTGEMNSRLSVDGRHWDIRLDDNLLEFRPDQNSELTVAPFRIALTAPDETSEKIILRVTWAGSQVFDFTSKALIQPAPEDNNFTYYWDVNWTFSIALDAQRNDLVIKSENQTVRHKVAPNLVAKSLQGYEKDIVNHLEGVFLDKVLGTITKALAQPLGPLNTMRLNRLLFQSEAPVDLETLGMGAAPVVFGHVSPSRTRYWIKSSRDGSEEHDSVGAGQTLRLTIEDVDETPERIQWTVEPAFGDQSAGNLGTVTGSGLAYVYHAPAPADLPGGYMIVKLTADASFKNDSKPYQVRTLVKVYREAVQVSAMARVMDKGKNLYLRVESLDSGEVQGTIDSPAGTVNETLAPSSAMPGFNWVYTAPNSTSEKENNDSARPNKPMAIGYRTLRFKAANGGEGRCDVIVPYGDLELTVIVIDVQKQDSQTLVTVQARWYGDGEAAQDSEGLRWRLPLSPQGVELTPGNNGTAVLCLPNDPLRSFIAVEARVPFDGQWSDDARHQARLQRWKQANLDAPPPREFPDYVGVRLLPLPWLDVPDPQP